MNANRLDMMAKTLAWVGSRRGLPRVVAGAAAAGALTHLGLAMLGHSSPEVFAAKSGTCKPRCGECERCARGKCKKKNGKKRCKRGKCKPKADGTPCGSFPLSPSCMNGVCAAPTCSDGFKNGQESDIDCGAGFDCALCGVGRFCVSNASCASGLCGNDGRCHGCGGVFDCNGDCVCLDQEQICIAPEAPRVVSSCTACLGNEICRVLGPQLVCRRLCGGAVTVP